MHATTLLALLPLIAPILAAKPFTSLAFRPAAEDAYVALEARDLGIWVGGKTKTYCPSSVQPNCPPDNATAFGVDNKQGTAGMDTEVPGGQALYVGPKGALSYTEAHSAYIPDGSYKTGFKQQHHSRGAAGPANFWSFTGGDATGFYACPVVKDGVKNLRVYANVKGSDVTGCEEFSAIANTIDYVAAWQYE